MAEQEAPGIYTSTGGGAGAGGTVELAELSEATTLKLWF